MSSRFSIQIIVRDDSSANTESLSDMIGVGRRTIQRRINALRNKGLLSREGGRSKGRWVVSDSFVSD